VTFVRDRTDDVRLALMILTRIPVGKTVLDPSATLARAIWAYPIVGALVGALAGAVYTIATLARLPDLVAAAFALIAGVLITGALHEDGLADFADGLGGGRDRESKLIIMRDSRIGTYGVVALLLAFLVRWAAIPGLGTPEETVSIWITAGALSRTSIAIILWWLPPARTDGLGAAAAQPPRWAVVAALGIGLLIALVVLGASAIPLIGATILVSAAIQALAQRHLQGHTGDVLGACALCCECCCLAIATAGWM
jgi:adenosylcobinamide-GDP ribazoletransferase